MSTNNISLRYKQISSKKDTYFFSSFQKSHGIETFSSRNNVTLLSYISPTSTSSLDIDSEKENSTPSQLALHNENSIKNSIPTTISARSFISTAHAIEQEPEADGGVKLHEVKEGDTIGSIAHQYGITVNTLYWANNIEDIDQIMPGDALFILPIAGLKHIVKENESLDDIARSYSVENAQIIAFNELPANGRLEKGQEIIIPGAEKDIPEPEPEPLLPETSIFAPRQYADSSGKNVENRHGKANTFPYGYCTWYVAQQKYIPWRGNAGAWLYNAKAAGYATGSKPKAGSIVVTTDSAYYGHVALVTNVNSTSITVKEMNYNGWGVVNTRTIDIKDRRIRGYIY